MFVFLQNQHLIQQQLSLQQQQVSKKLLPTCSVRFNISVYIQTCFNDHLYESITCMV
jgi:hypothetical protein